MDKPEGTLIPYKPRKHQWLVHNALKSYRFAVLVNHRRWGKTVYVINKQILDCNNSKRERPRYAYIAPTYKQAKDVAWDYVKHYAKYIQGVTFNEAELRADFPNGGRIKLYGADNPDSLRGTYFDGVVFDEVAQMKPSIWTTVLRPALADRKGWAIFIGTPQGHNFFYDLYQQAINKVDWYTAIFKASETGIIDAEELEAAKALMTEDEFNQEFECSFEAAIVGAYYGKEFHWLEQNDRICNVPYDPSMPVDTWWDLGMADSTSIWFTQSHPISGEIRVIDYLENSGEGFAFYAKELKEKGYYYRYHNAPHDIKVRELGTGKSRLETAFELGIHFETVRNLPVMDGINACRMLLKRCWFDKAKCSKGIEALKQYRKTWDEKNGVFKQRPLHDWTSHAADAFRYFAVGFNESLMQPEGVDKNLFVEQDEVYWMDETSNDITGY